MSARTFKVKTDNPDVEDFNGADVTVINIIDKPDENHDAEVLPIYVCLTNGGDVIELFEWEIETE